MTENEYLKKVNRVSAVTLIANAVLSLAKFIVGVVASSAALVSDAVHSMSDCFSTIVVMIGVKISARETDSDHPYGHERLECIAALVLSAMLFGTAIMIAYSGMSAIIAIVNGEQIPAPTYLALVVAVVSILGKGWMYFYTEGVAKEVRSSALHGDALHHLSDSLSSIGAAAGIIGGMCGLTVLDPVASIFIGAMIVKAAWDICKVAVDQLVDKSADGDTERKIADAILATDGVERIDVLRTRQYSGKIFVDVEIAVENDLTLIEAHRIAERVHKKVEHDIEVSDEIKHCMVHVNPLSEQDNHEAPQEEME